MASKSRATPTKAAYQSAIADQAPAVSTPAFEYPGDEQERQKRVMLAYSGGLDTTCILLWLKEKGYTVYCYCADVGQEEDFDAVRDKAMKIGAAGVFIEDLRREFIVDFIFGAVKANAIYESRYLLGTSLARPPIARRQVELALTHNCGFLAHGATGKGNDQVRLELAARALEPSVKIMAPWRDPEFLARFKGRSDLIAYAKEKGAPVEATLEKPWSMDENIFHCSYEAGVLENPLVPATQNMFRLTHNPYEKAALLVPDLIEISFHRGVPIRFRTAMDFEYGETHFGKALWAKMKKANMGDFQDLIDPLAGFLWLNRMGKKHGIGRIDIVENRSVGGLKSRGVYETPGGTILRTAHLDVEGLTMDREVVRLRDTLSKRYAELMYDGLYYSPEMEVILAAIDKSQEVVNGTAFVSLYCGNAMAIARSSPLCTYDSRIASMDEEGGFEAVDSTGFININCIRLEAYARLKQARRAQEHLAPSSVAVSSLGRRHNETQVVRESKKKRLLK